MTFSKKRECNLLFFIVKMRKKPWLSALNVIN